MLESAFANFTAERVGAVVVGVDATFLAQRRLIAEVAINRRLPTMFGQRELVEAGGFMSYGENGSDFFRRAARFVDNWH